MIVVVVVSVHGGDGGSDGLVCVCNMDMLSPSAVLHARTPSHVCIALRLELVLVTSRTILVRPRTRAPTTSPFCFFFLFCWRIPS